MRLYPSGWEGIRCSLSQHLSVSEWLTWCWMRRSAVVGVVVVLVALQPDCLHPVDALLVSALKKAIF